MKALLFSGAAIYASFSLLIQPAQAQPGSLDITFNPGSGANNTVTCMALQTNGQIVIGGNFTSFNGYTRSYIARLNADGSVDTSFDAGVGPNGWVGSLTVQPDGKTLIAGSRSGLDSFSSINGVAWNQPARLRVDGSVDLGFNTSYAGGAGASSGVVALASQPDGKVVIGGYFSSVSGTNRNCIARLNTNGSLDLTFNPGTGMNPPSEEVSALGLQSTGQIIVGGVFTAFNGTSCSNMVRLYPDGTLDTKFNAGLQDGQVFSLVVTPQDQIVMCGTFTTIDGYSRNGVARLNADGSVDAGFDPGLGAYGTVFSVCVQGDGKVAIGGYFSSVNNTFRYGVARFNTNGTLDLTFNPGTGVGNSEVYCVASQPNGETLIGGGFSSFNGTNINNIARLNGDGFSMFNLLSPQLYFGMNFLGVVSNTYRIEWTANLNTPSLWTPLFDVTLQSNSMFIADPSPPAGQRFYRAVQTAP